MARLPAQLLCLGPCTPCCPRRHFLAFPGMRILDTSLLQKLIGLSNGGYLSPLHGLLELFKGFGRDQLLAATFVYSAFEQPFQTALPVGGEPPLALTPAVA